MIAVDTSALLAILLNEPERADFHAILLDADRAVVSAGSMIEARMVSLGRGGEPLVNILDEIVDTLRIEVVPPGADQLDAAHAAFVTYAKGAAEG